MEWKAIRDITEPDKILCIIWQHSLSELWASIQPFRLCPMGLHLALVGAWVAVVVVTRVEALFPFSEADVPSNRSSKSFVFWQCEVGGAAIWWLASEFQLPVGDWPRRSNGAESRQCRVPPPHTHTHHLLLLPPCSSHPTAPTLRSSPVLIVTHCLLRLEMWLTTQAICWSTALTIEGFFLTRAVRLGYLGTGCGDYLSAMTVDLLALLCVLVVTSSAMEGK